MGRCVKINVFHIFDIQIPSVTEILFHMGSYVMEGVTWLISILYRLFAALANARLFNDAVVKGFAERVHIILGILMVFFIMINLFRMLADPDSLVGSSSTKKGNSGTALIKNIAITLALLFSVNWIFNTAYTVQDALLKDNVVGKIFFGGVGTNGALTDEEFGDLNVKMAEAGEDMGISILQAFFYYKGYNEGRTTMPDGNEPMVEVVNSGQDYWDLEAPTSTVSFSHFFDIVRTGTGPTGLNGGERYALLRRLGCDTMNDVVAFPWIVAALTGLFVCYIIAAYTIDMGIRIIKLAIYQLLAPIPIAMRLLPGQERVFQSWLKQTLSTFFEVFVRLAVMYFAVFTISLVTAIWSGKGLWPDGNQPDILIRTFSRIIIILALFMFMKQAPKLISSLLGVQDTGDYNLGIGFDKFKPYNRGAKVADGIGKGFFERAKGRFGAGGTDGKQNLWGNLRRGASALGAGVMGGIQGGRIGATHQGSFRSMNQAIVSASAEAEARSQLPHTGPGGRIGDIIRNARDLMEIRANENQNLRDAATRRVRDNEEARETALRNTGRNLDNATRTANKAAAVLESLDTLTANSQGIIEANERIAKGQFEVDELVATNPLKLSHVEVEGQKEIQDRLKSTNADAVDDVVGKRFGEATRDYKSGAISKEEYNAAVGGQNMTNEIVKFKAEVEALEQTRDQKVAVKADLEKQISDITARLAITTDPADNARLTAELSSKIHQKNIVETEVNVAESKVITATTELSVLKTVQDLQKVGIVFGDSGNANAIKEFADASNVTIAKTAYADTDSTQVEALSQKVKSAVAAKKVQEAKIIQDNEGHFSDVLVKIKGLVKDDPNFSIDIEKGFGKKVENLTAEDLLRSDVAYKSADGINRKGNLRDIFAEKAKVFKRDSESIGSLNKKEDAQKSGATPPGGSPKGGSSGSSGKK